MGRSSYQNITTRPCVFLPVTIYYSQRLEKRNRPLSRIGSGIHGWPPVRRRIVTSVLNNIIPALISAAFAAVYAAPSISVVPWNGHAAAYTLTFDDGHSTQLEHAIPILDSYELAASFYLISASLPGHEQEWKDAAAAGHEIGNHTATHTNLDSIPSDSVTKEVVGFKDTLEQILEVDITTFVFPYFAGSGAAIPTVASAHFMARGQFGDSPISWESDADWMELPATVANTNVPLSQYRAWIDNAAAQSGWGLLCVHGFDGETCCSIEPDMLDDICAYLVQKNIWVAPMSVIGSYRLAKPILESAPALEDADGITYSWDIPDNFPLSVPVLVELSVPSGLAVVQANHVIAAEPDGTYRIDFAAGEMKLSDPGTGRRPGARPYRPRARVPHSEERLFSVDGARVDAGDISAGVYVRRYAGGRAQLKVRGVK
ncbi:MAG: polysaccharide deacetylase family protein [Chitinivibrionales bacterium]|nr:polysaccharide deacetylase family protein [Chitinivibrionales bacterium]MBD3397387.1 polysaccharide deacetylase family protein [Chitinivibrionales bacterium]